MLKGAECWVLNTHQMHEHSIRAVVTNVLPSINPLLESVNYFYWKHLVGANQTTKPIE